MQNMLDMHMHQMQIARMTFDQFLTKKKISDTEAASRLGRDLTVIGRYRRRAINPSPEIIAQIFEWSRGAVTPREMLATEAEVAA